MKRAILLISAALLSVIAGVQTVMAQKVTLYSAGSKAYECDIARLDSIVFSDAPAIVEPEEIIVTVDAYGIAEGEHWFEEIDETNYYIDDIKYTVQNADLVVTGYNETFFKGEARIISKLKYHGRTMNVVSIGRHAFADCTRLTSVTIGSGVTSIGEYAFSDCDNLTSISIPNSVTNIGDRAFDGTPWYDNQPDGVVYAGKVAYTYKGTMPEGTEIILNDGTVGIADLAFDEHENLISITIPNGVTSIGEYAFEDCHNLTNVNIPEGVTFIGTNAFNECTSLTSITIPNSMTSIGPDVFSWCTSLTSVTIPESVTSIGDYAFQDCSSLTSVTIPNSVTIIGRQCFQNCTSLSSVTIPESVTSIGFFAFENCSSLTSIKVEDGNPMYDSRDNSNAIIDTATNTLVVGCKNTTIPNSVTTIGEYAFYNCSSLTSVTIPESVTSIGDYAFYNCYSLTSITIHESVTSIGDKAFYNCYNLTSVTIGSSVTFIGSRTFKSCSSLTDVYCYAENVPSSDSQAFDESSVSSATLHVPAGSVDAYKAQAPWKYFESIVAIE